MLEVVKRGSELDESGAGGLRIPGRIAFSSPGRASKCRQPQINRLPTGREFPQPLTQALQLAQYNVNAICPSLL